MLGKENCTSNEPLKGFRQWKMWSDLVFRKITGSNAEDELAQEENDV